MMAGRIHGFGWLSVGFRGLRSGSGGFAVYTRPAGSEVPRNAAMANAAPHTNARAAVNVFKPFPAIPSRRPLITDKLTKVRSAVSHFMEISAVSVAVHGSARPRGSPVLYPGKIL